MVNERVGAVMLERKQLHVGPEVTVRASCLTRWPHLPHMERIVIHAFVLDGDKEDVFLQCSKLAYIDLRISHGLCLPSLRLPLGEHLAGSIDVHPPNPIMVAHRPHNSVMAVLWQKSAHKHPKVRSEEWDDNIDSDESSDEAHATEQKDAMHPDTKRHRSTE